jgi:hypothetical protein
MSDKKRADLQNWLNNMGLRFNPFEHISADTDPFIPSYLFEHNIYQQAVQKTSYIVFASPGGGKTAFRTSLARRCRTSPEYDKIFPIIYKVPEPTSPTEDTVLQWKELLNSALKELLLHLTYHISNFKTYSPETKKRIRQALEWWPAFKITASQMVERGKLDLLINSFDPTADSLPNTPTAQSVQQFIRELVNTRVTAVDDTSLESKFSKLTELLLEHLGFNAIFILVDGLDAYPETVHNPRKAVESITWLLERSQIWSEQNIFVKFFIPKDVLETISESPYNDLTREGKFAIIEWNETSLEQIIHLRLQKASGGKFSSLDAISDRSISGMRFSPEQRLVNALREENELYPREIIRMVNRLMIHHVEKRGAESRLTIDDIEEILSLYHIEKTTPSGKSTH